MALSITQAGTGNSTTSGTTFSVTPTVSFAVNDTVVVCSAHDNLFSGAPYISSVTDSQGNTYSLAAGNKTQGGSGADRATVAIYRCNVTTALSTSDTITITFSGSLAAKAVVLYKISAASNKKASLRLAAAATPLPSTTNFSGGSPTMVNGEALIRALAIEDSQTVTGDSDTTRGSWSAAYSATALGASATASMQIFTQTKIVTANGTQTWDVTFTSADTATAYGIFEEVAAFAVLSRTATGSGTGSDVADGSRTVIVSGQDTGNGGSAAESAVVSARMATGSGVGDGTATQIRVLSRDAIDSGSGGSSSSTVLTSVRLASGSGVSGASAQKVLTTGRSAVGGGQGSSQVAIKTEHLTTAYGSGGASTGDGATGLHTHVRTANGSGDGASGATVVRAVVRLAEGAGQGLGEAVCNSFSVVTRIGEAFGTGSSEANILHSLLRLATGSGAGGQFAERLRTVVKNGSGSGQSSGLAEGVTALALAVEEGSVVLGGPVLVATVSGVSLTATAGGPTLQVSADGANTTVTLG